MLDLETLGNVPGCAIISIGAVEFDLNTGLRGRKFYRSITLQSNIDAGLFVQGETVEWWFKQSEDARKAVLKDAVHLNIALDEFSKWFNPESTIWGNGADFDIPILRVAYHKTGLKHPWKYNMGRDVRTWIAEAPWVRKSLKFNGTRHEPIADCEHQIDAVVECRTQFKKSK
jgi:DNA polymerase III epsilon subunit-like protein